MQKPCTASCSRSCPGAGFTVIELVVSLALGLVVTGAVLALSLSSKSLFEQDRARVRMNQTLRAAREFLVTDLHQAGERLASDFPAVEVIDGGAGAPDTLIVRRGSLDVVLPVCEDVTGTDTSFSVAQTVLPPTGCLPDADADSNSWPDNLQVWRDYRVARGGEALAYIYNPVSGDGEFFTWVAEDNVLLDITAAPSTTWQFAYPEADGCRVYVLEERRYELEGELLQLIVDRDTTAPIHIVDDIFDFQITVLFQDGTQQAELGYDDLWADLKSLRVSLHAVARRNDTELEAEWGMEVMPRNVLSNR